MPTAQRLTAERFFDLHLRDKRSELIAGEVVWTQAAGGEHGIVAMRIGARLLAFVEAHDLGVVCAAETGFLVDRNPDTVRAPDAAFVSRQLMGEGPPPKKFWPFPPDLAVEVVSPSESADSVQERVGEWLAAGTQAVWILYPGLSAVHVYRSPTDVRILRKGDVLTGGDVLPSFTCAIVDLFK